MTQQPSKISVFIFFMTLGIILFGSVLLTRAGNPNWANPNDAASVAASPAIIIINEPAQ